MWNKFLSTRYGKCGNKIKYTNLFDGHKNIKCHKCNNPIFLGTEIVSKRSMYLKKMYHVECYNRLYQ